MITVALVYKSQDFLTGKRKSQDLSGDRAHLQCDALPIGLPSPWEQAGGKEGYTSAGSWCPLHQKVTFSGSDDAVTARGIPQEKVTF